MPQLTPAQRAFIRGLPKTETHLHFEAALTLPQLQALHGDELKPQPAWFAPEFRYDDFAHFIRITRAYVFPAFATPEKYLQHAGGIFREIRAHNVRFLETSINLFNLEPHDLDLEDFVRSLRREAPADLEVRIYCGMRRDDFTGRKEQYIRTAARSDEIAGLDLHGFETLPLEAWSVDIWAQARAAGKRNKAHAGELAGAPNVREVMDRLKVDRVQHGVRAVEDPDLVRRLAAEGTVLDLCPISNVRLRIAPSIAGHQLRSLLRAGVRCTVNSDDPIAFGNYITDDLVALMEQADFTLPEIVGLLRTGWEEAAVPPERRQVFLRELDAALVSNPFRPA